MSESVVKISYPKPGIAYISMEDREHKNTFSKGFVQGLLNSFQEVSKDLSCKVVILTGYDSYFASGGTQEGLLALYEGKGTFADTNFYSLALECPIPVISAMQGHGIGGGFVLGLFADIILLSRESIYTTNFMKYGFTPGMGATLILPEKLGLSLSEEMLLTAANYQGEQLKERGVPFQVLPRSIISERAFEIAEQLLEKPRASLIILKRHLTQKIRGKLQKIVEQELEMHEQTFHQTEVKSLIEQQFVQLQKGAGHE